MSEQLSQFKQFMAEGVRLNNVGAHQEALSARLNAYALSEPDSVEAGRAARDIGHSFVGLEDDGTTFKTSETQNTTLAAAYAEHAVRIHNNAREANVVGAEREYRASAGYFGTMALARAIAAEKERSSDELAVADAKHYLNEATSGPENDQYTINFAARHATALGLYESSKAGRASALDAWRLGRKSEAPDLPYSNPMLSRKERRNAQRKAMSRSVGAFVVGSLAGVSSADSAETPRHTRRRSTALSIAERLI